MNTASNLEIIEETTEGRQKSYRVARKNPKLPWPSNATIVQFAAAGKYKKFRMLSEGDPNVVIVQVK